MSRLAQKYAFVSSRENHASPLLTCLNIRVLPHIRNLRIPVKKT